MKVAAVLPALNEREALPHALRAVPEWIDAIVVDNGSTDATPDIARLLGAHVVAEPRRGFGAACKAGVDAAGDADIIVFMDADGTCDWGDVDALVEPIRKGKAHLVLGRRVRSLRERGAMPFHVSIATRVLGAACGRVAGVAVHDVPPYRAIRRDVLLDLDLKDRTYGWPLEMVIRAGREGYDVVEVPVRYKLRVGQSKVTGTLRGTLGATARMAKVLWQHR